MWALVRMKPKLARNEMKKMNSGSRPSIRQTPLRNQDDLADVLGLGEVAMGVARSLEREALGDERLELARSKARGQRPDQAIESLAVPPAQHVQAKDPLVLVHHREALPPRSRRQRHAHEALHERRDVPRVAG